MIRFVPIALLAASFGSAQDAIPEKTLKELKEATVFVKLDAGRERATGSGFLMKREGDIGYIVTNAHVVAAGPNSPRSVTVVFGSGTREERSAAALIVAEDEDRDLAILKIEMKNLPKPIDLAAKAKLRETLPVYILGFPFGEALSTSKGSPAITIGKGSISSLRLDDTGEIAVVQIDGDLNPGNSGGPIVDRTGALVGVAVAKVTGTQIGLAIPPRDLDEMLLGRVQGITFEEAENREGSITLRVKARLIDPMGKMKGVSVVMIPRDRVKTEPKADEKGLWGPAAPDMKEYALKVEGDKATADIALKGDPKTDVVYCFQTKYVRGDGKPRYTQPGEVRADFSRGTARKPVKDDKDDWLGDKDDKKKPASAEAGKSAETGTALLGEKKTVVDAAVTPVKVSGETTIANLCWSDDAKFVYTLESAGLVRKIAVPEFKEERQLNIGKKCTWLERSREGLLVVVAELQELWILDESKLTLKRKVAVAGATVAASAPGLSIAFAGSGNDDLSVVDLKAGKVVKQLSARKIQADQGARIKKHKEGVVLSDMRFPTVTPDGKYFFCMGFECLHRFKISGTDLVYEEMGPRLGQNAQRIEISSDSKYIALPSGGGNYNVSDHPKIGTYGTYVYKVSDLQMPVISISSGHYPRVLAFDKAAGTLYAQNFDKQFITFTPKGIKEKEYAIAERGDEPRQFLVHPGGRKILVLTSRNLLWVELPE